MNEQQKTNSFDNLPLAELSVLRSLQWQRQMQVLQKTAKVTTKTMTITFKCIAATSGMGQVNTKR